MARIVGYIAASLDGFIADPHEGLKWLTERKDLELGQFDYNLFIKRIRTVVMGRATYDWLEREGRSLALCRAAGDRGDVAAPARSDGEIDPKLRYGRRCADR